MTQTFDFIKIRRFPMSPSSSLSPFLQLLMAYEEISCECTGEDGVMERITYVLWLITMATLHRNMI